MRARATLVIALFVYALGARAEDSPLKNADVIQMVRAGISPAVIQAKIAASRTAFDTSTPALVELSKAKVPDAVVTAMIASSKASASSAIESSASNRTTGAPSPPPSGPSRSAVLAAREEELRDLRRRIEDSDARSAEELSFLMDTYTAHLLELRRCQTDSTLDTSIILTPLFEPSRVAAVRLTTPPDRETPGNSCFCIVDYKGPVKVLRLGYSGGLSEHWREEFLGIEIFERTIGSKRNRGGHFFLPPGEHLITIFCDPWYRGNSISATFKPGDEYRLLIRAGSSTGGITILGIEPDRD